MIDTPPLEPDAEARILGAARNVLAAHGYRGFSVEAVGTRATVDPAVIRGRWSVDEQLLIDALAEPSAVGEIPDLGDSRAELLIAVGRMTGLYSNPQRHLDRDGPDAALLALAAICAVDPALTERLQQRCVRRNRDHVAPALRRAAARGDLPTDVDTDLVQDVWEGAIAYRRLVSGGPLDREFAEALLDMVMSGMAPLQRPQTSSAQPRDESPPWWRRESAAWLNQAVPGRVYGPTDDIPVRALREEPQTLTIDGHRIAVATYAWRDFQPLEHIDGSPLMVSVVVSADGTGVLPPVLRANRIAVLHGDQVWVAPLVEESLRSRTSRRFQVMARHGPRWGPGGSVDVVAELQDGDDSIHLVRTPDQPIEEAV